MRTYVLFGHTASPGYAGGSVALAVVSARDIESAARKLKGAVIECHGSRGEDRIFRLGKRTPQIIRRIVTSKLRELRGRQREFTDKRPDACHVEQRMSRYSSFSLSRMLRIR